MPAPGTLVHIAYRALPGQAETAHRELSALIATVVATEPDCAGIQLYREAADPARILLLEQWSSQAAYTGPHMQTPHLRAFIARAPQFLAGRPEISFWDGLDDFRRPV